MQDAQTGSVPVAQSVASGNFNANEVLTYRPFPAERPRKVTKARLTGEFDGLWADVWTNPKRRVFKSFASGDGDSQDETLATLVLAHNIPDVSMPITIEALDNMDGDLYLAFVGAVADALKNALSPKENGTSS